MRLIQRFALIAETILVAALPAAASHLVTGNGFGFAVVAPETGNVTKFYAHPYSFVRPDPTNALSEGIASTNFIKGLEWRGARGHTVAAECTYEDDSQIIHLRRQDGEGRVYMPFGLSEPAVIISWQTSGTEEAGHGAWSVDWAQAVDSQKTVRLFGTEIKVLKFNGIEESLLLIPLTQANRTVNRPDAPLAASSAWALISLERDGNVEQAARDFVLWRGGLSPEALARREIAEVDQWRVKPTIHFRSDKEMHLWRQSEVMLRIAQSREPNRPGRYSNGLIVASLPDGVWFTPWVRDMAWATVALARMGHRSEARAALLAYFNARPTGKMRAETDGADYQISVVRYFGNGAEEPFFTQEGSTNIEFDDWGEALWVLGEYLKTYDDPGLLTTPTYRGSVYASARDFIVKPLLANLEKYDDGLIVAADTSIWEERQKDKKHFAFSTAMAIVGLHSFAEVARRNHDEAVRDQALSYAAQLQKGFNAAFIRDGHLHGTLEPGIKNDIDGALLAIINFGVVTDPAIVRDTVQRMELLKVASGGYRRVRSTYTDPKIYEYWYERQEFLFVDFNLAELNRKLGNDHEAAQLLNRIVDKAADDHNIIPEMYVAVPCKLFPGNIGDPTGALPMVGYGAGEYILHLLGRDEEQSHPIRQ